MSYLGENIGKLGFGLMRLPLKKGVIDIEQLKRMVDLFLSKGFDYFDTAYGYHDGNSEIAIKEALVDRYPRQRYHLATKLPAWAARTKKEAREMLFTSLARTGAGYFDFYLLHNMGDDRTEYFDRFEIWEFLGNQKQKGLIKHLGISIHDKAAALEKLLIAHPEIEFIQLQINYADWEDDMVESKKCFETARRHGKPVIVMEPVKGGSLTMLPDDIADVFRNENAAASLASWAIRFAVSLDGIVTVLSGMSTLEQMDDNVSFMENFRPLDTSEKETIKKVQVMLKDIPSIPCTGCAYCLNYCPQNIAIPGIFKAVNNYLVFGNLKAAKANYAWEARNGRTASKCIGCRKCEKVCPQHISVAEQLRMTEKLLEEH